MYLYAFLNITEVPKHCIYGLMGNQNIAKEVLIYDVPTYCVALRPVEAKLFRLNNKRKNNRIFK